MAKYSYCPTEAEKATPAYKQNVKALWIIFGVSIAVCFWYILASFEAHRRTLRFPGPTTQYLQANLLSGALVSLVAITLLYTTFPQPIEATLSVILALSQASALGWLDFPPDARFRDVFCTKPPDLFALGLTLWAAWDAKEKYFEGEPQQGR